MGEKAPHGHLLSDDHNDHLVHPTAPPSYDEAMTGGSQSLNNPVNPYQGYPSQAIPNHAVPQPISHGMPVYPNQSANVPIAAVPQPVPYGTYGNQLVNVPNPPGQVQVLNIPVPASQIVAFGPKRVRVRCCHCGADIKSTTITSNKATAHLACLILCIFLCCFCAWIPYCMSSCKKVDHKCPNCKGHLGTYNA